MLYVSLWQLLDIIHTIEKYAYRVVPQFNAVKSNSSAKRERERERKWWLWWRDRRQVSADTYSTISFHWWTICSLISVLSSNITIFPAPVDLTNLIIGWISLSPLDAQVVTIAFYSICPWSKNVRNNIFNVNFFYFSGLFLLHVFHKIFLQYNTKNNW
jgi:hypothetical protein